MGSLATKMLMQLVGERMEESYGTFCLVISWMTVEKKTSVELFYFNMLPENARIVKKQLKGCGLPKQEY